MTELTHPQRHVVKDCCNRLRAVQLEDLARQLDKALVEPEAAKPAKLTGGERVAVSKRAAKKP